jgi:hypothetical protein
MLMKFLIIVTVLFLLPLSVSAGTFLDTFEDGNLDGWRELVPWDREPGSWEIVDGGLHGSVDDGYPRLFTTGDDTWKDYTVEFDVRPLKKHGRPTVSIAARVQEKWFVQCRITEPEVVVIDGANALGKGWVLCSAGNMHRPKADLLFFKPHPLLKLFRWAHFKLSVEGDIFTFWINDEQVMAPTKLRIVRNREGFEDFPEFQTGGVGIGLSNYTARFDNVTVTGDSIPDSGAFAVTPQGKLATTWGNLKKF